MSDQNENLRNAILSKKARIAEIERTLNRPAITEYRGQPVHGGQNSRLRLEEERQHLLFAVAELERELERLSQPLQRAVSVAENSAKTAKSIVSGEEKKPGGWQDIEITFLSDHRVSIRTGQTAPKTYNYGELGFQDRRSGKSEEPKPNRAWVTLCQMAKHSGTLPRPSPGKERTILQKRMEEIRKKLRGHFGIEGDPIPFNGSTYQTSFRITCGASFET